METTESNKRNVLLDFAKGIAILIVVFGHSLQGAMHGGSGNCVHLAIQSFQMEFFFALSGVAATYASRVTFREAIRRRTIRLGIPYVSWVILFYLAEVVWGVKPLSLSECVKCLFVSGFWFLRQLLVILISYEMIRSLHYRAKTVLAILAGAVWLCVCSRLPGEETLVRYAICFYVGAGVSLICSRLRLSLHGQPNLQGGLSRPVIWCGRNSLALYAVHWNVFFVFLSLQLVDFSVYTARMGVYLVAGTLFVLYLMGSVAIIWTMRKLPLLPQMFLGDKH